MITPESVERIQTSAATIHNVAAASRSTKSKKWSFSGHETFPFRYTWLSKGVQHLETFPDLFRRDDSVVRLGVGKNMVKSIRHWCEALSLIEPINRGQEYRPTELGQALFGTKGWDPFLEDIGTLWLLHWLLVRRPEQATTWYLVFTQFNGEYITRENLTDWLTRVSLSLEGVRATPSSIKRDVDVFIRTYVPAALSKEQPLEDSFDCPLVELGLLRELEPGKYQFARGQKPSLPEAIFAYSLIDYWFQNVPTQRTIQFENILHSPGSPGGAFKLSENALTERLEMLPRWASIRYDDTAGMRILLNQDSEKLNLLSLLRHYYNRRREEYPR